MTNVFDKFTDERAATSEAVAADYDDRQARQITGGMDIDAMIANAQAKQQQALSMENPLPPEPIDDVDDESLAAWQDVPLQMVGGLRDAAESIKNLGVEIGGFLATPVMAAAGMDAEQRKAMVESEKKKTELPDVQEPSTVAGAVTRPVTQFAAPFAALGKVTQGTKKLEKIGKFEPFLRGIVADFVAFEGHEERLSDAIAETSAKDWPFIGDVANYLKSDPGDSDAEGRMKNALEGAGLGKLADSIFKSVKYVKNARDFKSAVKEHGKIADKVAKSSTSAAKKIRSTKLDDVDLTIERPNQEQITIEAQRKMAASVGATLEDFMKGRQFKDLRSKEVMNIVNKGTILQEEQFVSTQDVARSVVTMIDKGDPKAAKDFIVKHLVPYLEVDAAMKDTTQDLARAMNFRSQSEAVRTSNKFLGVLANADAETAESIVKAFASSGDSGQFGKMVDAMVNKKNLTRDVVNEVYRNFILSSPKTLAVDTIGSAAWFTFRGIEKVPAAVISKIRRGFFQGANPDGVEFKEAQIMLSSMTESFSDGMRFIGKTFGERDPSASIRSQFAEGFGKVSDKIKEIRIDSSTKFDTPRGVRAISTKNPASGPIQPGAIGKAVNYIGNVVGSETLASSRAAEVVTRKTGSFINKAGAVINAPTEFMAAKDDIAKGVYYKADVKARAYRRAVMEGLEGEELATRMRELEAAAEGVKFGGDIDAKDTAKFMKALANEEPDALVGAAISRKAIQAAKEATFTDELGPVAKAAQNFVNKLPGGAIVFPFVKTPTKLLWDRFIMERTPLGVLGSKFRTELMAGGARADEALGQLATGSGLMWWAYNMATQGRITGEGPTNGAQREALMRTGWRPRSLKVGDQYIEIGRLDPIASFLVFPANMAELLHERDNDINGKLQADFTDYMVMNTQALARMTASKSWLASAGQIIDAIESEDPDRTKRLLRFYGASMTTPNFVTFFANEIDPDLKRSDSLWGEIKKRWGGNDEMTARDVFGNTIQRDPQLAPGIIPLSHSNVVSDPLMHKLVDAGANLTKPTREVFNVEITEMEHQRLMDILKESGVEDALRKAVTAPTFEKLPKTERTGVPGAQSMTQGGIARRIYNGYVKAARMKLLSESPDIQERVRQHRNKLATQETMAPLGAPEMPTQVPTFSPGGE